VLCRVIPELHENYRSMHDTNSRPHCTDWLKIDSGYNFDKKIIKFVLYAKTFVYGAQKNM